ncbi:MAG: hypothetical protein DME08_20470 [Candidatus Rokuibacteriota bacterium]|nr:MAG: hypothetical protein DME08_20470 [Candidatus Rokubacteria bacterium]
MQALDQRVARADLGADLPDPAHSDDSHLDRLHRQAASLQSRGRPSNVLRIRRNGMPLYAIRIILVVVALLTGPWPASAQDFPTKPVELVIPYGPGGSHDLTARAIASVAQQYLGQPLLVVLKPGGGGAVGSQYVIRAKPDGYTIMLGGTGPNTIFALVQKAPIGPDQFTPIARINYSPPVFAVRNEAPWKTMREALDYMKKNPGKFNFANSGTWGAADFPMRMMAKAAGVEYNNIPFDGGGPATLAVLAASCPRRRRSRKKASTWSSRCGAPSSGRRGCHRRLWPSSRAPSGRSPRTSSFWSRSDSSATTSSSRRARSSRRPGGRSGTPSAAS